MARFIECDKCMKRMKETPKENEGPRKIMTLTIKTIDERGIDTNIITKDLCAKCGFEFASMFARFFRETDELMP